MMLEASLHRRLTDLITWATARITTLDSQERYEDSYALTQELREWLLCLEEHPERVEALLVPVPRKWLGNGLEEDVRLRPEPRRRDGLLEI